MATDRGDRASPDPAPAPSTTFVSVIAIVMLSLLHLVVNGYSFGGSPVAPGVLSASSDHSNVLPWVVHYQDPTRFAGDLSIQLGAEYSTWLWRAVALVGRAIPLAWLFFALHVASVIALHTATWLLGLRLADGNRRAALLASLAVIPAWFAPAGVAIHDPAFYTRGAALPVVILAVVAWLSGNLMPAALALAVAMLVHPLSAVYGAALIGTLALCRVPRPIRSTWRPLVGITVLLAAAAYTLPGRTPIDLGRPSGVWLALQHGNNVMHVFPGTWSWKVWRDFGVVALAVLGPWLLTALRPWRRLAVALFAVSAASIVVGWGTSEFRPTVLLMQLQPIRALEFVMVVLLCMAAAGVATARRWTNTQMTVLVIGCLIGMRATGAGAGSAGVVAAFTARSHAQPPAEYPWVARSDPWSDVQLWFATNTRPDAYVLTPPDIEGFRSFSGRAHYVDWKQGTLSLFNEPFGVAWQARVQSLMTQHLDPQPMREMSFNYDDLPPATLAALVQREGFTHVIVRTDRDLAPFTLVYANEGFRVWSTGN